MTVIDYRLKEFFFDREKVKRLIGKANAKNISKALAFVQRRSRSSLRRRKKTSAPGTPPSVHSVNDVTSLKNILFGYDPNRKSGIVGPVRLNKSIFGPSITGTVPELHEFGGAARLKLGLEATRKIRGRRRTPSSPVEWRVLRHRPRPGQPTKTATAFYPPRPFMGPALIKEAPKFPSLWLNTVRE